MIPIPRLRRYRVFVAFAALALFLIYRVVVNSEQWDASQAPAVPVDYKPPVKSHPDVGESTKEGGKKKIIDDEKPTYEKEKVNAPPVEPAAPKKAQSSLQIPTLKAEPEVTSKLALPVSTAPAAKHAEADITSVQHMPVSTIAPDIDIPLRKPPHAEGAEAEALATSALEATTKIRPTQIHWTKVREHFPVPKESIIPLPSGKPLTIPRIQYTFGEETEDDKTERLTRLAKVKAEMERAWAGYREHAWLHDELSPVSKKFRDPFCGWAATLVDALDTLWIMGMKKEFEDAVEAVKTIDFTYSPVRAEIPVFETTIRYLGGLLAAYDVSGGKSGGYSILLDKAVELAEVLMGVFDTPNRMPILYYQWRPESAKRPKRAAGSASIAELGSLLMEFTRLAQLTQEDKYYDAVARITNALVEWQQRGVTIPGIFPERVDLTGCNRTADMEKQREAQRVANEAKLAETKIAESDATATTAANELDLHPLNTIDDESSRSSFADKKVKRGAKDIIGTPNTEDKPGAPSRTKKAVSYNNDEDEVNPKANPKPKKVLSDAEDEDEVNPKAKPKPKPKPKPKSRPISDADIEDELNDPFLEETKGAQWHCTPQGLTPGGYGSESYSLGGSQDSTYEYFPKEWLLLGGLDPVYRELHLNVTAAAKEWLLYRPMVPGDRDLLFSAKMTTHGHPERDASTDFEVTHLTCFLGGMFALGGQIFGDKADVEIGKKLTDGCVWAYESMPVGIMPEGATVVPCANHKDCPWNETLWYEYLDPIGPSRDSQIDIWVKQQEELKQEREAKQRKLAEDVAAQEAASAESAKLKAQEGREMAALDSPGSTSESAERKVDSELRRDASTSDETSIDSVDESPAGKRLSKRAAIPDQAFPDRADRTPSKTTKTSGLEDALNMNVDDGTVIAPPAVPGAGQIPIEAAAAEEPSSPRPMTHKEYVQNRLETERLPPGFVSVGFKHYILRPEAIESVWYMYRITGDKTWQDKGWRMFEAIIKATQTEVGHSAIESVMELSPGKEDAMESFWLAETLKYFYLLYSEPDLISLDDWVLNTEAHPFKRPT